MFRIIFSDRLYRCKGACNISVSFRGLGGFRGPLRSWNDFENGQYHTTNTMKYQYSIGENVVSKQIFSTCFLNVFFLKVSLNTSPSRANRVWWVMHAFCVEKCIPRHTRCDIGDVACGGQIWSTHLKFGPKTPKIFIFSQNFCLMKCSGHSNLQLTALKKSPRTCGDAKWPKTWCLKNHAENREAFWMKKQRFSNSISENSSHTLTLQLFLFF